MQSLYWIADVRSSWLAIAFHRSTIIDEIYLIFLKLKYFLKQINEINFVIYDFGKRCQLSGLTHEEVTTHRDPSKPDK